VEIIEKCSTLTHMTPGDHDRVGLRALQQNASAVVARAAAGEVVEITDRGRPVAHLVPLVRGRLETLVDAGRARPATIEVADLPPQIELVPGERSLSSLLAEARVDER
jgi:prevent-host-death family protein